MFNDKHWLPKNWDQNGPTVQRNYIKDLVFPYGNHVKQTWIHLLIAVGSLSSQAFIFHFLHRWNSRVMIYNPISAKKHEHFYSKIFFLPGAVEHTLQICWQTSMHLCKILAMGSWAFFLSNLIWLKWISWRELKTMKQS